MGKVGAEGTEMGWMGSAMGVRGSDDGLEELAGANAGRLAQCAARTMLWTKT